MIPCANKKLFGVDCLGCGTQRALLHILKGNFVEAFYQFPAIYTTLAFFLVLALHFVDRNRNYHKLIIGLAISNAVIMVISYCIKMSNLLNL